MSSKPKIVLVEEKTFKDINDLIRYEFLLIDNAKNRDKYFFIINKTLITNQFFLEIYKYKS